MNHQSLDYDQGFLCHFLFLLSEMREIRESAVSFIGNTLPQLELARWLQGFER